MEVGGAGGGLGLGSAPSLVARLTLLRFRGVGGAAGGGVSLFIARRWPSNTDVSQTCWPSTKAAQILAAAAASLNGPATRRSCMPGPLLPSFTTMIGRKP